MGGAGGSAWAERRQARALADDRRAGSHSRRQIQTAQRKWLRHNWRFLAVLAMSTSALGAALWWILPDAPALFALGVLTASACWVTYVFMLQTAGIAHKQVGVDAETWTAQELRKLRRHGWSLVNHVMLESRDIDHALLGPGGYFSIETKYRANWQAAQTELGDWARRARDDARALSFRLGLNGSGVVPVVAVWTSALHGRLDESVEIDGVVFCSGRDVRQYLANQPAVVAEGEVATRFDKLVEYVGRRDTGELRDAGPQARTVGTIYNDLTAVLLSACGASLAVLLPGSLPPQPWWSVAAMVLVVVVAWAVRRRWSSSLRVRLCATAAIASAIGWVAAGAIYVALAVAFG